MSKLATKIKNKKIIILCLIVIIAVQFIITVHCGMQKNGFHLDEILTFEIANIPEGRMAEIDGFMNSWHSGSYYQNLLTLGEDNRFDFFITYANDQNSDVHPFLYYFVVRLVCSMFPNVSWNWLGIAINICFCSITSIFLFKLSRAILKSNVMALICVIAWGWSVGAAGTAVFHRMYAMLGMWCVIFALLLTRLVQNVANEEPVKKRCWVGLLLITAAGTLTQYYFLVFCFIACLILLIYLLVKREWKRSLFFAIAEGGGILLAYVCFPTMMYHIFNDYRGEEAFENFVSTGSAWENLKDVVAKISNELFNGWVKEIIIICVVILILYWLFCIFHPKFSAKDGAIKLNATPSMPKQFSITLNMDRGGIIVLFGLVCIGYIVLISRIAPYQVDRYYMCIYPFLSMIAVYLIYTFGNYIIKRKSVVCILSLVIVFFVTGISYIKQTVPYLYTNYSERMEALSEYIDYPVIVMNFASHNNAPDRWIYEFEEFHAVFRCSHGSFDEIENAVETKDLDNGFLVYAVSSTLSDEEFIENVSAYVPISNWEVVTSIGTKVYFCETANLEKVKRKKGDLYRLVCPHFREKKLVFARLSRHSLWEPLYILQTLPEMS